jgi:ribonuclease T1
MVRRRLALVALCALIVVVGGWMLARTHVSHPAPTTSSGVSDSTCPMSTLPPEVADTVKRIHAGGPFPFPHSDGAVFSNREGHLPRQRVAGSSPTGGKRSLVSHNVSERQV